jgi:hypothetical protein
MRQLWRDIDQSKHKAGLGPAPEPTAPPSWDFAAMLERAAAVAGDAAAWMTANAPAACAFLVSNGAELLRGVPVVGRLVDLIPRPFVPSDPSPRPSQPPRPATAPVNGRVPEVDLEGEASDPEGPGGTWVH